jgi:glutathione synthase/RimK-type ligase-like ATP-grasp enzyme
VPSIAFVTMDSLEGYVADDHLAVAPLEKLGWSVAAISWRAPSERWECHAGVVIRSPWDYQRDVDRFLAALERIERSGARLANPLALVRWNVRKSYLLELAARGCPLPRTELSEALTAAELDAFVRDCGDRGAVAKPLVGAGGVGTHLLHAADPASRGAALAELTGRAVLLQRFLPAIRTEGEHSLVFFRGTFSHAVRKVPTGGEFRVQEERGGEILPGGEPAPDLLAAAEQILRAAGPAPLYARVDLVREAGAPVLMELEVIEPSLYLRTERGAPGRFAAAVDAWASARG